ncbi:MAG: hypothetical protein QOC82_2003 [Frankiaceae bacterium]|nr:hypothetical protein [Frankiaceae bacterium]
MLHRHPALALLAAAGLSFGVAAALPSSAHLVADEPFGAMTAITANSSGTADVVLYDDATLSPRLTHNPDVSITGPGRVVGFTLTRTDHTGDTLYVVRMPKFAGGLTYVSGSTTPPPAQCTSATTPLEPAQPCPMVKPTAIKLHEGYYHLAVLTDGKPLRITLHLHGLQRGRARVGMQANVRTAEADLPQQESIGSNTITYGAETSYTGARHAAMVVRAKLHADATLLAQSVCARNDSGAAPPYAFSPPCPGGASRGMAWESNNPRQMFGAIGGLSVYDVAGKPIDPTGLGGSFVDSNGPAYLGGVGVWSWSDAIDMFSSDFIPVPGQ